MLRGMVIRRQVIVYAKRSGKSPADSPWCSREARFGRDFFCNTPSISSCGNGVIAIAATCIGFNDTAREKSAPVRSSLQMTAWVGSNVSFAARLPHLE